MEIIPAGSASVGINGTVNVADDFAITYDASSSFGAVLLGVTLWIYLKLKRRGILETKSMRQRTLQSKVLRTF